MPNLRGPYEQIKSRIQQQCPDITFVSMWNQQVRDMKKSREWNFSFPACFIEFVRPEKVQILGNGWRIFEPLFVKVHIISTFFNATNGIDAFEEYPFQFDLNEEVYAALFQYEPDGCVAMFPTAEEGDYDHDDVYHTTITFQTNFVDGSRNEPVEGIPWSEGSPPNALDIILNPWVPGGSDPNPAQSPQPPISAGDVILIQDDEGPLFQDDIGYLTTQTLP